VKVKPDENLGRPHITLLKDHGYVADRLFDEGLSGIEDSEVWRHIKREQRFLITLDLGFSDVRRHKPGTHPGVLLLRPRSKGRESVLRVLKRVLAELNLGTLEGCLAVADESRTRVRRPVRS
jgi:predicted nuclease of predicted toxin-antitoxin system